MKALELSRRAEQMVFSATALEKEMAAELRRLAEVNAELVEALDVAKQYLLKRIAGTGGEGETKVLPTIMSAIAKAKAFQ